MAGFFDNSDELKLNFKLSNEFKIFRFYQTLDNNINADFDHHPSF
jgi:hypothetical protein